MSKITYRPMKIKDGRYEGVITAEQQENAVEWWLVGAFMTNAEMQECLAEQGAPKEACYRGADRILQKLRRAGVIRHTGSGKWVQV